MKTKPDMNARWDQADYSQANQVLLGQIAAVEGELRAGGQPVPSRPAADDMIAQNDALNAHLAQLKVKSSMALMPTPAPSRAASAVTQGRKPTLTELVLDAKAAGQAGEFARPTPAKTPTLTAKVLAAKSAKDFTELKTRRENSTVIED